MWSWILLGNNWTVSLHANAVIGIRCCWFHRQSRTEFHQVFASRHKLKTMVSKWFAAKINNICIVLQQNCKELLYSLILFWLIFLFFSIFSQISNPHRISKYIDSLPSYKNALIQFDKRERFHIFMSGLIRDFSKTIETPSSLTYWLLSG